MSAVEVVFVSVALGAAIVAWLSMRQAQRTADIMDRQFAQEYRPSLYIWPLDGNVWDEWEWEYKVANTGRGPALNVIVGAHWGPAWQKRTIPVLMEIDEARPRASDLDHAPPLQRIAVLPGGDTRVFRLPFPRHDDVAADDPLSQYVLHAEWTDPTSNERLYRCWEVHKWNPSDRAGSIRATAEQLSSPLPAHPGCEQCPVRNKLEHCPIEKGDK